MISGTLFAQEEVIQTNCSDIKIIKASTFVVSSWSTHSQRHEDCSMMGDCKKAENIAKSDGLNLCYEKFHSCTVKHKLVDYPSGSWCEVELFIEGNDKKN